MEQIFTLVFYIFLTVGAINIVYYLFFFIFAFAKANPHQHSAGIKSTSSQLLPPVSIIICAKNEQVNLKKNIPRILKQEYPAFEIILINDGSTDDTEEVMEALEKEYTNVNYVKVANNERFWGNKKYALTLGIKRAAHDILLFTDADCYPASKKWVQEMSTHFTAKKELVLGYGAYARKGNSLLNKLIRFETVMTAIQYFSYAMNGRPYMGVGRNLSYTTKLFYEQKGFISHMDVRSGDDDLFVNEAGTKKNIGLAFSPSSFTISEPKITYASWIAQKRRHITTASHYKTGDKFFLGLFYFSQISFMLLATVLLILQFSWQWVALAVCVRYLVAWIAVGASSYRLHERDIAWLFPFLELFLVFNQLSIFMTNRFSKPATWK